MSPQVSNGVVGKTDSFKYRLAQSAAKRIDNLFDEVILIV